MSFDAGIENEITVNKTDIGRKKDLPAVRTVSTANSVLSSKWSKFLSSDVVSNDSVIAHQSVSDCVDGECCSFTSHCSTDVIPSVVSTAVSCTSQYIIIAYHMYICEDFMAIAVCCVM